MDFLAEAIIAFNTLQIFYLNYYFSGAVCACFRLSECLSAKKNFSVQNGSNSQIRWTDISNSRIQARRAWFLVYNIVLYFDMLRSCNWGHGLTSLDNIESPSDLLTKKIHWPFKVLKGQKISETIFSWLRILQNDFFIISNL